MERHIIQSISYINGFKVINYQPELEEDQMQTIKMRIIKNLQFIFPMVRNQ